MHGNSGSPFALIDCSHGEETTTRWKISHHGHDSRLNDLLAILALLILIVAAWHYFGTHSEPPSQAAFIVPSQSVRW